MERKTRRRKQKPGGGWERDTQENTNIQRLGFGTHLNGGERCVSVVWCESGEMTASLTCVVRLKPEANRNTH